MLRSPLPRTLISLAWRSAKKSLLDLRWVGVVESKKMRNMLRANTAQKVNAIRASPGSKFEIEHVIVEFE